MSLLFIQTILRVSLNSTIEDQIKCNAVQHDLYKIHGNISQIQNKFGFIVLSHINNNFQAKRMLSKNCMKFLSRHRSPWQRRKTFIVISYKLALSIEY